MFIKLRHHGDKYMKPSFFSGVRRKSTVGKKRFHKKMYLNQLTNTKQPWKQSTKAILSHILRFLIVVSYQSDTRCPKNLPLRDEGKIRLPVFFKYSIPDFFLESLTFQLPKNPYVFENANLNYSHNIKSNI